MAKSTSLPTFSAFEGSKLCDPLAEFAGKMFFQDLPARFSCA